jgi:hypothetical protein
MVVEHRGEHPSEWAAMGSIASKFGMTAETLRIWVCRARRSMAGSAPPANHGKMDVVEAFTVREEEMDAAASGYAVPSTLGPAQLRRGLQGWPRVVRRGRRQPGGVGAAHHGWPLVVTRQQRVCGIVARSTRTCAPSTARHRPWSCTSTCRVGY